MNTFITLMCFALVASAAAISVGNNNRGYNYQKQSFRPSQPASNSGIYSVQQSPPLASFNIASGPAPQYNVQSGPAPQFNNVQPIQVVAPPTIGLPAPQQFSAPIQQQYAAPAPQYHAPVPQQQQQIFSAPAPVAPVGQYQQTTYQPRPQQTIVSKEVYIHSAPEETEEINAGQGLETGPNRKNYRVVFIKAPAQNLRLNVESLKRAQATNEEKTVIYVLSKKPDLGNLQSQLAAVQTQQKAHKPEVHFIKYKTQEEAQRAQQEIQAQYDSLGGSTSVTDEGIAPIRSVIGGGHVSAGSIDSSFNGGNVGSVGSTFSGGNAGSSFSGGNVGSSFNGGNAGSVGSAFTGGNNFAGQQQQQQQFAQQSYQSSQGSTSSSVSFGTAPSQKYLPASKK